MNWAEGLYRSLERRGEEPALWTPRHGLVAAGSMRLYARKVQALLGRQGLGVGDHVLFFDRPGPELYAAAIAVMAYGMTVMLVEPWMAVEKINSIVDSVRPKALWSPWLGQLWASRIPAMRRIPLWLRPKGAWSEADPRTFSAPSLPPAHRAILTFSSGTSGAPKGIPRTHDFMDTVVAILRGLDDYVAGSRSLDIFPNMVFYQIDRGRTSYIMPPHWPTKQLRALGALQGPQAPQSLACGPAFLARLMGQPGYAELRQLIVGGALVDHTLIEQALRRFPQAKVSLIYGSTEVEPVSVSDAALALQRSRQRGYFQILSLGQPIKEIRHQSIGDALWVAGPHVNPDYLLAGQDDQALKRRDDAGVVWHNMGDRIEVDTEGFWYRGRSFQNREDFALEQKIYSYLGSSAALVFRTQNGQLLLVGEGLQGQSQAIRKAFPEISGVVTAKIYRDARHRARIDRKRTLNKMAGL